MQSFDHFHKEELIIDLYKAGPLVRKIFLLLLVIFVVPFYFIWIADPGIKSFIKIRTELSLFKIGFLSIISFMGGIVLHELVHGITWAIFCKKGFKSIRFGIMWEYMAAYCHCKEPLKVKYYLLGAIMPAILIGFIPAFYGLIVGKLSFLVFGIYFTLAAVGDYMVIDLLRKENKNDYVQDHPSAPGCYIYRK